MKTTFSKPSEDLRKESNRYLDTNLKNLQAQAHTSSHVAKFPNRDSCLLCKEQLTKAMKLQHRNIDYVLCNSCGHLQTFKHIPEDYPYAEKYGMSFDKIYPDLNKSDYESRVNRIYTPKLDWLLSTFPELDLNNKTWLELGSGAGSFLHALTSKDIKKVTGIERDENLVAISRKMNPDADCIEFSGQLSQAVEEFKADILVAFFVLEHVSDAHSFFSSLANLSQGTLFYFSVPTFGFATFLESASNSHWARNLDSVLHTQLYTDESINEALNIAGMEKLGEWIFGQDSDDLTRMLLLSLQDKWSKEALDYAQKKLSALNNSLQQAIDQAHFADARHVLAIKK